MNIKVLNVTNEVLIIPELSINLIPNISVDLLQSFELFEIQKSATLFNFISSGSVVVNNGILNLSITDAIKYILNNDLFPTDRSGRPRMHQTSRPANTITCWMGVGDNIIDHPYSIGNGVPCIINHRIGEQDTPLYIDYMTVNNETFVHEGCVSYQNCQFDKIFCQVVPQLVSFTPASNTNFRAYNGIIIPAAGNGDVQLDQNTIVKPNGGLVQVKYDETGIKTSAGFWDATWNNTTKLFENITARPDGSGNYNLFYYEMIFSTFVIDYFIGSGNEMYECSDVDKLWHGMRLKITAQTCGLDWQYEGIEDHEWKMVFRYTLHRQRLV